MKRQLGLHEAYQAGTILSHLPTVTGTMKDCRAPASRECPGLAATGHRDMHGGAIWRPAH